MNKFFFCCLIALLFFCMSGNSATADTVQVAVASNFMDTMQALSRDFEKNTNQKLVLITGSSGKHYAHIVNGAPFDVFLSADVMRPLLLEKTGRIKKNSRFTYAIGQLALWSRESNLVDAEGKILYQKNNWNMAMANPKFAPYGKAAQEVLSQKGLWASLKNRMVRGENIGQTFHFVRSGNAKLGFVSWAQIKRYGIHKGSFWKIPQKFYAPIKQQAVLLTDNSAAASFLSYLKSEAAIKIIRDWGYEVP